jgi:hypothetical protein
MTQDRAHSTSFHLTHEVLAHVRRAPRRHRAGGGGLQLLCSRSTRLRRGTGVPRGVIDEAEGPHSLKATLFVTVLSGNANSIAASD